MSKPKMYVVTDSNDTVIGVIHGSIPESDLATHLISIIPHNNVSTKQIHHNYTDADGVMRWSYTPNGYDQHFALFVKSVEVAGAPTAGTVPRNTDDMAEAWSMVERYYPDYNQSDTIAMSDDLSNIEANQIGDTESSAYKLLHTVYAGDVERACADLIVVERNIYERTLLAIKEEMGKGMYAECHASAIVSDINEMKKNLQTGEDFPDITWSEEADGYHLQVNESTDKVFKTKREFLQYVEGFKNGLDYAGLG